MQLIVNVHCVITCQRYLYMCAQTLKANSITEIIDTVQSFVTSVYLHRQTQLYYDDRFPPDTSGWPHPSCTFPSWIADTTWRDLSGKHMYQIDAGAGLMRMFIRHHLSAEPEAQRAYRCAKGTKKRRSGNEFTMLSFTSYGW